MGPPVNEAWHCLSEIGYTIVGQLFIIEDKIEAGFRIGTIGSNGVAVLLWPQPDKLHQLHNKALDIRNCDRDMKLGSATIGQEDVCIDRRFAGKDAQWFMDWMAYTMSHPWTGLEESVAVADKLCMNRVMANDTVRIINYRVGLHKYSIDSRMFATKDMNAAFCMGCFDYPKQYDWEFTHADGSTMTRLPPTIKGVTVAIPALDLRFRINDDIALDGYEQPLDKYFWRDGVGHFWMLKADKSGFAIDGQFLSLSYDVDHRGTTTPVSQVNTHDLTTEITAVITTKFDELKEMISRIIPPNQELQRQTIAERGNPAEMQTIHQMIKNFEMELLKRCDKALLQSQSQPPASYRLAETAVTAPETPNPSKSIATVNQRYDIAIIFGSDDISAIGVFLTGDGILAQERLPYDWNGVAIATDKHSSPIIFENVRPSELFKNRDEAYLSRVLLAITCCPTITAAQAFESANILRHLQITEADMNNLISKVQDPTAPMLTDQEITKWRGYHVFRPWTPFRKSTGNRG